MGYLAEISVLLLVLISMFVGWWVIWVPVTFLYAVRYHPTWVVLVAVLVDGYYGAFYSLPYITLITVCLVGAAYLTVPLVRQDI